MAQAYVAQTGDGPAGGRGSRIRRMLGGGRAWRDGIWRRGIVLALWAVLLALVMLLHAHIPNRVGNLGSLLETFLPWFGVLIPVLLLLALARRSATALVALVLPVAVWLNLFGGLVPDRAGTGGQFTVATHNVNAENPDPAGTARDLARSGAQVVALEELTTRALPVYEKTLAPTYPYRAVQGTVALWSKYPLTGTEPVDIRLGWVRALRTDVRTPHGQVAVYVAHLPSVRVKLHTGFSAGQRDRSADALGEAIAGEKLPHVVLLGDLNGTMNDRSLNAVTAQMRSTQGAAGDGFGFSWPSSFPMARIDQIMVKGVDPVRSWTLPRTPSDHLPIAASLRL
jgi:vancomycin resistance protein VanJ